MALPIVVALTIISCFAEVRGALSRGVIARELRLHRNEIRGCYQRELVRSPGASGRVTVTFIIHSDGWTDDVDVPNTEIPSERLGQCIKKRVLQWRFPSVEYGGRTRVTYGYRLARSNLKPAQSFCYAVAQRAAGMTLERRTGDCRVGPTW